LDYYNNYKTSNIGTAAEAYEVRKPKWGCTGDSCYAILSWSKNDTL